MHTEHGHRSIHGDPGRRGHAGWGADFPGRGWAGGRRRLRRGDIRRAVLSTLLDAPAHGYEVMRRLEAGSGGLWRPSPGSIYPMLQMLEDEGLVRSTTVDGTRTYQLTEDGRTEAGALAQGAGSAPWERTDAIDGRRRSLREGVGQAMMAARQVAATGSSEQIEAATEIVLRARRELYQLLAGE